MIRSALGLLLLLSFASSPADEVAFLTISSTTSTEHSGLYDYLLPLYEQQTGVRFRVVAVGTGQAIQNAMRGDADLLIVHHRESEERFVAEGYGLERHLLMYNDFVLVGPDSDPAAIATAEGMLDTMHRIAQLPIPFISRGDNSGTHKREIELWSQAGISVRPASGTWYWETGTGMGPTLNTAAARDAYTLTDRATWTSFGNRRNLKVLYENDPMLHNQYSVIVVNSERHPHVKRAWAEDFVAWLLSEEGQQAIASFNTSGAQLFFPNASESRSP